MLFFARLSCQVAIVFQVVTWLPLWVISCVRWVCFVLFVSGQKMADSSTPTVCRTGNKNTGWESERAKQMHASFTNSDKNIIHRGIHTKSSKSTPTSASTSHIHRTQKTTKKNFRVDNTLTQAQHSSLKYRVKIQTLLLWHILLNLSNRKAGCLLGAVVCVPSAVGASLPALVSISWNTLAKVKSGRPMFLLERTLTQTHKVD